MATSKNQTSDGPEQSTSVGHEKPLVDGSPRLQAYTVEQVAEMLQIGRDKVYGLIRTKRLNSIKIGRLRRITHRQLTEFLARLEEKR